MSDDTELFGSVYPEGYKPVEVDPNKPKAKGMSVKDHLSRSKPKQTSHSTRTRRHWEKQGYTFSRVEHKNPYTGRKHDLLGWADNICFNATEVVLVQECSEGDWRTRLRKMCSDEIDKGTGKKRIDNLRHWLAGPFRRVCITGWKQGERFWAPTDHWVTDEDIEWVLGRRRA